MWQSIGWRNSNLYTLLRKVVNRRDTHLTVCWWISSCGVTGGWDRQEGSWAVRPLLWRFPWGAWPAQTPRRTAGRPHRCRQGPCTSGGEGTVSKCNLCVMKIKFELLFKYYGMSLFTNVKSKSDYYFHLKIQWCTYMESSLLALYYNIFFLLIYLLH